MRMCQSRRRVKCKIVNQNRPRCNGLNRNRKSSREDKDRLFNPNRLPGMRIVVEDAGEAAVVEDGALAHSRVVLLPDKLSQPLL